MGVDEREDGKVTVGKDRHFLSLPETGRDGEWELPNTLMKDSFDTMGSSVA